MMDVSCLRSGVACWSSSAIPLHQIRCLAIAFPQTNFQLKQSQTIQTKLIGEDQPAEEDSSDLPLLCHQPPAPHAFLVSGSQTGELAHWFVPSYRSIGVGAGKEKKQCGSNFAIPRSLMLRQGASACTAITYCRDGLTQMFCAGTSEGFLTLWSVGGGRCIRSELVLPFSPSQILFYQRYNPLAHRRTHQSGQSPSSSPSPSPSPIASSSVAQSVLSPPLVRPTAVPASSSILGNTARTANAAASTSTATPAASTLRNYVLCCSEDSRDVYVVELPTLSVLCILQHRSQVASMALVPPTFSKQRTPFLVTITTQHHICLWDLSQIEKKLEDRKKLRTQQLQTSNTRSPARPLSTPPMSNDPAHPSSLANHSASIIQPISQNASSSNSASVSTGPLTWDEPTQSYMLPLPPFSFTLSPLFVPVALSLSPCGSRAILVFPYAFMSINMHTFEVEGSIHSMITYIREADFLARQATGEVKEEETPENAWNEEDVKCISLQAPFQGAGFLSVPAASASTGTNAGTTGAASGSVHQLHSAPDGRETGTQYLVLWNATGECIWIFAVVPSELPPDASPALNRKLSKDEFSLPTNIPPSPSSIKRSSSQSKLGSSIDVGNGHLSNVLPSSDHTSRAFEAPELDSNAQFKHAGTRGSSFSGTSGIGALGQAPKAPRITLVGKCMMRYPAKEEHKSKDESKEQKGISISASPSPPPLSSSPPTGSSRTPVSVATPGLIAVHLSGHTIYGGGEDGAIYQWHIPLCAHPTLFAKDFNAVPKVFYPTHVSKIADAFPKPATSTHLAPTPTRPTANSSPAGSPQRPLSPASPASSQQAVQTGALKPSILRSATTPMGHTADAIMTPSRLGSFAADPSTASTMLVDHTHEAVLLAVGHASGAIKVYNVLSKASAHLDLPVRHTGLVTCMLHLLGWSDGCMLATGGVDGKINIFEMSTGTLHHTLSCPFPILSFHKPPALSEEVTLGPHYRGSVSSILYANCADATLRAFCLNTNTCVFVGRELDSPVKSVYRPLWAITSDTIVVQTRAGTVYVFCLSTSQLLQLIDVQNGANTFLQRHDLVVPGSQLSILAHRLHQLKHLRKKPLPSLTGSPDAPQLSRADSSGQLHKSDQSTFLISDGSGADGVSSFSMRIDEEHFTEGGAGSPVAKLPPPTSYDYVSAKTRLALPLKVIRAAAAFSHHGSGGSGGSTASVASPSANSVRPLPLLSRHKTVSHLIDSQYQKDVFRLNMQHQSMEKEMEEKKASGQPHHHAHTAAAHHYSALNPPVPPVNHSRPLHHSTSVSTIINPVAAQAHAAAAAGATSNHLHVPTAAGSTSAGGMKHSTSSSVLHSTATSSGSPSPPPAAGGVRSPIACVDVVTSLGSSINPLSHLHVNVYVWNVHQLLPFLAAHSGALVAMGKRQAAIVASKNDPANPILAAAANAARSTNIPPAFYVICGLLSTLFDWDSYSPLEPILRGDLRCYPPSPPTSFASLSDNSQSLTLLFPNQSRDHIRWCFDADFTARHMMALTTTVMHLMEKSDTTTQAGSWFASILRFYHVTVPRQLRQYQECDISVLAPFALNVHRPVHQAARVLIQQCFERMDEDRRLQIALDKGKFYDYALPPQRQIFQAEFSLSPSELVASGSIMAVCENGPGIGVVYDEEMLTAMLLTWLGLFEIKLQKRRLQHANAGSGNSSSIGPAPPSIHPSLSGSIPTEGISEFEAKAQYLTNSLLRMIAWPVASELEYVKCALACELLGKGLLIFRHHITEPQFLLRRLYSLSLHQNDQLAKAAHNALLDAGKIAPTHFITCMGKEAMNFRSSPIARQGALMCLVSLIKRYPLALSRSLPATVRMILSTLDPSEATLRKTLLQASTSALYALTAKYPQVSFHQTSQRFAVGTANGVRSVIIVYDLRTATKWRILEGHTGDIHAVSFHPKGLSLASYSATENPPSVRVWSTGGGGFLSGLLGMEGKCTHSWPMLPCARPVAPAAVETKKRVKRSSKEKSSIDPAAVSSSTAVSSPLNSSSTSNSNDDISVPLNSAADENEEEAGVDSDDDLLDVEEGDNGAEEEDQVDDEPQTMGPRRPSSAANQPPARFTIEELLSVKIMWVSEKSIKLKRENGEIIDFHLG